MSFKIHLIEKEIQRLQQGGVIYRGSCQGEQVEIYLTVGSGPQTNSKSNVLGEEGKIPAGG